MEQGQLNLYWARYLVAGLVQEGVKHAVISPGSRSTPLVLALAEHPEIRDHVIQDERSAAFFALGLGKGGGGPAVVVGTSGSAPANWYPAVIEAAQDSIPLLLISADRPAELQSCGANQTIDQSRLFGSHVRAYVPTPLAECTDAAYAHVHTLGRQAVEHSRWPWPGPVHVNVPFREPLVPTNPAAPLNPRAATERGYYPRLVPEERELAIIAARLSHGRGVIVCGRGVDDRAFPEQVMALAERLNCPVFADILSGLRFGRHPRRRILSGYDAYLRDPGVCETLRPAWVLRFGALPVSSGLQAYLAQAEPESTCLVAPYGPWPDPAHRAPTVCRGDPSGVCRGLLRHLATRAEGDWLARFLDYEHLTAQVLEEMSELPVEAKILRRLTAVFEDGAVLYLANSTVIRDADGFLHGSDTRIDLVGSRGASGIDGNVSTVLGLAATRPGPVIGVLGDLALFHDMNGLLAARGTDVVLVVFNNGGGGIFEYLPQRILPGFERYWLTSTGLDIKRVADLYDLGYKQVHKGSAFAEALSFALENGGPHIIEIQIERAASVRRHQTYWRQVIATQRKSRSIVNSEESGIKKT